MQITFTKIHWRSQDDSDVFNMHAIKSIMLDTACGIITIEGTTNTFSAPYCELTYGGGFTHFELLTKHPYENRYINIALFESTNAVCVANHSSNVPKWFEYKCNTYVHV